MHNMVCIYVATYLKIRMGYDRFMESLEMGSAADSQLFYVGIMHFK